MSQKIEVNKFSLKQIVFICIAAIVCIATLGLGLGLGFGTGNKNDTPAQASEYTAASLGEGRVSTGDYGTMAIDATGNLWAFGRGANGRLGDMNTSDRIAPINITAQAGNPLNGRKIVQVSTSGSSGSHTMAIDSQGNLWAFGNDKNGRLGNMAGNSTTDTTNSTPINITAQAGNPLNGKQIVQVAAGLDYTVAIDNAGSLWAFGNGNQGRLGISAAAINSTPINITAQAGNPLNGKQIIQVSAGHGHTLAIDSTGSLWAFGYNAYGTLGNMTTSYGETAPINITAQAGNPLNGKQIVQIAASSEYTMAIDAQGNLWGFGRNGSGQIGNMSTAQTSTPISATAQLGNPLNGKKIVKVSAGGCTTAIDSQGNLWVFGNNAWGNLGNMSTTASSTPINITAQAGNPLNGKQIAQSSSGSSHTVAIDSTGDIWSFGYGELGQLGIGVAGFSNSTPFNIKAQAGNPLNGVNFYDPLAVTTSSISGSPSACISVRTNFTAGWGETTASGGIFTSWTSNSLSAPNVKRNNDTQAGRVRYEFDANGINTISTLTINGTNITLTSYSSLTLWNSTLYLRIIQADSNRRLIVEMDRINTNQPVTLAVTTTNLARATATVTSSPNARISVRTDFTTGWGTTTASGGTYTGWTAESLTAPDVARNSSAQTGRIRYEFDAGGIDTVTALTINGVGTTLSAYPSLTMWNSTLYLRIQKADSNRRLIVEMDRINTDQLVILSVTTTRNVEHSFNFSNSSHISSRMKMNSGAETTSLNYVFDEISWSGNTGTINDTEFVFTSRAQFSRIIISRAGSSDIIITSFSGSLAAVAPGSGLVGAIYNSSPDGINTVTILLMRMEQYDYTWTIETQQQIQVQQILNPPAGATAIANPALLTLNSSAGAGWADAALAPPVNQFGKTFAGWFTHPDYTKGTLITTTEQLQQQITATGGAIVFLYARWA